MPILDKTAEGDTELTAELGVSFLIEVSEGCTVFIVLWVSCE